MNLPSVARSLSPRSEVLESTPVLRVQKVTCPGPESSVVFLQSMIHVVFLRTRQLLSFMRNEAIWLPSVFCRNAPAMLCDLAALHADLMLLL